MGTANNAYIERIERWRAERLERLTSRESWLSLVGLHWLHEGSYTIGSSEACDVVLPAGTAPAVVGRITVEQGGGVLFAEPGTGLRVHGEPVGAATALLDGSDGRPPTRVRIGSVSFHLIRREDELAVRVRDRDSAARADFAGIEAFPIDERWRIRARFEPAATRREVVVPSVAGPGERYEVPGAVVFEAPVSPEPGTPGTPEATPGTPETTHRLTAFLEAPDEDLFFVFGDATNRTETYGGGRFLYTPQPDADGFVDLDFNRAYNPPCVFTPFATCPLPLAENRLGIRVEAGELIYRSGSTGAPKAPNVSA